MRKIVVVGGGFAGINVVRQLRRERDVEITLIDRKNYHLFQPLLYQVAAGQLSSADIAPPIRSLFSGHENVMVLKEEALSVDLDGRTVTTDRGRIEYDYLVLACGAQHDYFGHPEWEPYAPGLKTIEQAEEIRNRLLGAYEEAERDDNKELQRKLLTFVIVGGGPTGVELAGAVAEMSRRVLAKDFRNIDPTKARVVLVQGAPRILPPFSEKLSAAATKNLEKLGVEVITSKHVTSIDEDGVCIGDERIEASTVLWAAGVKPSELNETLGVECDKRGLVIVEPDLSIKGHPEVFVIGDQAHCDDGSGKALPGVAMVALEEGTFVGKALRNELRGRPRGTFRFFDRGKAATIGRSKAVVEVGKLKFNGFLAWITWLFIHLFYLTGFENRVLVLMQWAWAYLWNRDEARLILSKEWRFYAPDTAECKDPPKSDSQR